MRGRRSSSAPPLLTGAARLTLLASALLGCGNAAAPASTTAPAGPLEASAPQLAEGVTAMEATCSEGAEERCDALDSDCDGRVDEGCDGALDGPVVVTAAWNGPAALSLELEGAGDAAPGGAGPCDGARLRRVAIAAPDPGTLRVALRRADACGSEDPVTASVTVAVGGRVLGTFNRAVDADRVEVVAVELRR